MKDNGKLSPDVNIEELAALTKNFSGAEIEGLVKAAQSTAMNRLIKATNKVEVDPDAIEKLLITRKDFLHALEFDCSPVSCSNMRNSTCTGILNIKNFFKMVTFCILSRNFYED